MAIKLLIVDDSAFMRKIIADTISEFEGIEIVGRARNGCDALEMIPRLNPDVISLDIEMPKLNGIDTLREIKKDYDIPVIMLSSHSGTDITIEALELGAFDFIEKPNDLHSDLTDFGIGLWRKVTSAYNMKSARPSPRKKPTRTSTRRQNLNFDAVVVGASTGGPRALVDLVKSLPRQIKVPIFIVQHMPKGFTTSLAARLDNESNIRAVEAEDGMIIENNMIYLAPGDYHMTLAGNRIKLDSRDKLHGVRPAVDYLFETAVDKYGAKILGIMLTGMGRDGTRGMKKIKDHGGYNIAQSARTCVVYGMPGSAVNAGVVDEVLDLEEISSRLNTFL